MKKLWRTLGGIVLGMCFLTACTQMELKEESNFSSGAAESNADIENTENGTGVQQEASIDSANRDILAACADTTVTQTMENSDGKIIVIDAEVDVDGINRVSCYRYVPQQLTEETRKALFKKRFPAESWDVNEAAVYDAEADAWKFVTPRGESWSYWVDVSEIPDEQIMNLERADEKPDYAKESTVSSVRIADAMEVEDMLLIEVTGCVPREIEQFGQMMIEAAGGIDAYSCNYIHICEESAGCRYAKAVFKQVADGMPVTAWHNFTTVTTGNNVFPEKAWGSLFSMEEVGLEKAILTPAEAVAAMQEQIDFVQIQEAQICVTKINLEYLAVFSSGGEPVIVPVWRFWLGNDEMERSIMCEQIFAVNAVSGELIWENRGAFAE